MTEIHENDYGWTLFVTVKDQDGNPTDLSSADSVKISLFKSNNVGPILRTASFVTDGSDGQIYYTVQENDIDEAGTWEMQIVVIAETFTLHSNIIKFKVYRNL